MTLCPSVVWEPRPGHFFCGLDFEETGRYDSCSISKQPE